MKKFIITVAMLIAALYGIAANNSDTVRIDVNYLPKDEAFVLVNKFVVLNSDTLQIRLTLEESEKMGISPADYNEVLSSINQVNVMTVSSPNCNPGSAANVLRDMLLEKAAAAYDKNSGKFLNFETTAYLLIKHTKNGVLTITEDKAKEIGIDPVKYRGFCAMLNR
ncbi:hypothetical protein [uncultured Muribaculum sp.]|uniref:hypothetical protein n=1 Tax=uncultured Muribaculum sp. TaxID=1918613 RepID=UPI00266F728C|nr:hypothetical protein [uncultured Muribaculum sp.]